MSKITIVGIGPGSQADMTADAIDSLRSCDVVVGYNFYLPFIKDFLKEGAEIAGSGMRQERERVAKAFEYAAQGKDVCVISSGDAGIYGMAPLAYEMRSQFGSDVELRVVPGISAFQKAAALLGAPIGHDFCIISLSDLMTPWGVIEKRIKCAAEGDFVTAVYNPRSVGRYWQLYRLKEIFMQTRSGDTPVGYVRQAGREEQSVHITTLAEFDPEKVDMLTIVIIGNSRSFICKDAIITPRGYYNDAEACSDTNAGQSIMMESFRTIEREMKNPDIPLDLKWAMLHAIHTTADFDMENIVRADKDALERIFSRLKSGEVKTIVTDVTMASAGIRKGALKRLGLEVKCYLNEEGVAEEASALGLTRTQIGIRRAVREHPDALYVFGNAPTALLELSRQICLGNARPCGIIAAPVGFVHVCESKHSIKPFTDIPKIIVEGRKGGSNLAATLTNAVLCRPDAEQLRPGRDV